jgi:hypothetical protein
MSVYVCTNGRTFVCLCAYVSIHSCMHACTYTCWLQHKFHARISHKKAIRRIHEFLPRVPLLRVTFTGVRTHKRPHIPYTGKPSLCQDLPSAVLSERRRGRQCLLSSQTEGAHWVDSQILPLPQPHGTIHTPLPLARLGTRVDTV